MATTQFAVDWEERVDLAALRSKRVEKTLQAMNKHGLDALLAVKPENVRYVAAIKGVEKFWAPGECTLLCKGGGLIAWLIFHESEPYMPWLKGRVKHAFSLEGPEPETSVFCQQFAEQIKEAMKDEGATGMRLGVDMLNPLMYQAFVNAGLEVADASALMIDVNKVKMMEEIELMKVACAMGDAALFACMEYIRPGLREYDVSAKLISTLRTLGADWYIRGAFASGERTSPFIAVMGGTDRILQPRDLVIIDCTHAYMGYWGDITRTFLCGDKATEEQRKIHKTCYEVLQESIEIFKPGNTTLDLARFWDDAKKEGRLDLGILHGVGLLLSTAPRVHALTEKYLTEFLPGMVATLETYLSEGRQGVYLEEQVLVTEDGNEVMSRCPFDERLM